MPDSIVGLLIIVIAIFPGLLGNKIYKSLVGNNWREKDFQVIVRLIGFSVVGIVFYVIVAQILKLPPPVHLLPNSYSLLSPTLESFNKIIYPYIGHLFSGFIAGMVAAIGSWVLAKFSSSSVFPSAWDDFVRTYSTKHWVIVGLKSGEAYAGKLRTADVSVSTDERDIVLEEPCLYEQASRNYKSLNYQYLFVSSENLFSLAAIHDPKLEKRIVPIGEYLFEGALRDEQPPEESGNAA